MNLSLEELKNVTITFYSNTGTVQIAELSDISHFLNQHHSSLARHVNAASRKSLEFQAWFISLNREPIRSENVSEYLFLAALVIIKVKSQEDQ